jgi:molybdopterin-guanine dinucleotide biosynthesis adapter protein
MRWGLFDTVIIVDWSAANVPSPTKPSADAIWIGVMRDGVPEATYHRTRTLAEAAITQLLDTEVAAGRRVLLGCDFPMGFPAGFAGRLTGFRDASAVWEWLAGQITDAADNRNNRFDVAAAINARMGGGGPFWGRPAGLDLPALPPTKAVDYALLALPERRAVEMKVPKAQPVWKLFTTGSVGSQTLMGLPMIHRLAQRPDVAVWPFDLRDVPVVVAEIYPSLLASAVAKDDDAIKDRTQVRLLATALWRLAQKGRLIPFFDVPEVAREEGWILGAGHAALLAKALTWA